MKKEQVAVKITDKNISKVYEILKMFGEKIHYPTEHRLSNNHLHIDYPYVNFNKNEWCGKTELLGKKIIKPKQLRNLLAKEHLKEGDVVVLEDNGDKRIGVFVEYTDEYGFEANNLVNVDWYNEGCFENFIRYATEEEKALLNPKKELEVGKWYKHADGEYPDWLVFNNGKDSIFGFNIIGSWNSFNYKIIKRFNQYNNYVEATEQEVKDALVKEAKKRYNSGDNVKSLVNWEESGVLDFEYFSYYNSNDFWVSSNKKNICVFRNGKWAEVVKDDKPKKGDVCKFWVDYENEFIVSTLVDTDYGTNLPFKSSCAGWFQNAKVLTPEQVTELLFTKKG